MWEPRRLTIRWASTACYRNSFTFYLDLVADTERRFLDWLRTRYQNGWKKMVKKCFLNLRLLVLRTLFIVRYSRGHNIYETRPLYETLCSNPGRWTQFRNPVIPNVVHHLQKYFCFLQVNQKWHENWEGWRMQRMICESWKWRDGDKRHRKDWTSVVKEARLSVGWKE
jgi:hypothetical protein